MSIDLNYYVCLCLRMFWYRQTTRRLRERAPEDPPDRIRLHLPYSREASLKSHTKSPDCIINPFLPPLSLAACPLLKFLFR